MEPKHTPEPWWDESGVAHAKAPDWTENNHACVHPICEGNGMAGDIPRACACVNGCEGINPEAVKELLEALDRLAREVAGCWGLKGMRAAVGNTNYGVVANRITAARAAIAKAKGGA